MMPEWDVFMVYGSFEVPNTDKGKGTVNFIIIRKPIGRIPWSKKVVPAINRLVREWYPISRHKDNFWNCEGTKPELWNTKLTRRFEWNGSELVEIKESV
jgi:hypothetical protein